MGVVFFRKIFPFSIFKNIFINMNFILDRSSMKICIFGEITFANIHKLQLPRIIKDNWEIDYDVPQS